MELLRKHIVLAFLLASFFFTSTHFVLAEEPSARGFSIEESAYPTAAQKVLSNLFWAPRHTLNGVLYGIQESAVFLSDPDFVEDVKDILYIKDPELLWYPRADFASGFRPTYGGGVLFRDKGIKSHFTGEVFDSDLWRLEIDNSYRHEVGDSYLVWRIGGLLENRDDIVFSGFGGDPEIDPRNQFRYDVDEGILSQDRRQFRWGVGLEDFHGLDIDYTGLLMRRSFEDHGRGDNDIRESMNTDIIPGFTSGAPVKQIYNEISVTWDTRQNKELVTPGFHGELYTGVSAGYDENESNLLRFGGDFQAFIPTFHEDRLIVPRLVLDIVEDLNDEPIPFSEYPRQQTFRGVATYEWIRSDKVSVVPSIEYQWRMSHMFSGHLFLDYLAVGRTLAEIQWDDGLWAVGAGMDFRLADKEFARAELAAGSEGFQARITLGLPIYKNERSKW